MPDTIYVLPDSLERSYWYYWRVLAQNFHAGPVYSVETKRFYLDGYPSTPNLLAPDDGAIVESTSYLVWSVAADPDPFDSVTYTLQVDDDGEFASPEISISGLSESGLVLDEAVAFRLGDMAGFDSLQTGMVYYWRVRADDQYGLHSAYQDCCHRFYFESSQSSPPKPFPIFSPPDGSRIVTLHSRFYWGSTTDSDPGSSFTYNVQYSTDSLFGVNNWTFYGITDTTLSVFTDSLYLLGQHIFWRVMAIDNDSLVRMGGIPEESRSITIFPAGDANTNGITNGIDATYLVAYLKGQGVAPDPIQAGDANGNCTTNGIDVTYMVAYLKGIGGPPVRPDCGEVIAGEARPLNRGK